MASSKPTKKLDTKIVTKMPNKRKKKTFTKMDHEFVKTCKQILPPPKDYSWNDLEEEIDKTFDEELFLKSFFEIFFCEGNV